MGGLADRRLGVGLVLGTALISGVSIYVNRFALSGIPSSVFAGAKNLIVALALAAVLLATREARTLARLPRGDWIRLAAIGLVGGSIPFLLFFQGLALLASTGAALASFLHKTMFLYVAVFALLFLRERIDRYLFAAAALLIVGTGVLVAPAFEGSALGAGLILLATVLWAGEITLSKATLRRLGANVVAFGRMGFGAAFILVFLGVTGQGGDLVAMSGVQWQWVLVTAGFLFAYVTTFYHGLKRIDAASASSILVLGAVVSVGLAALLDGSAVGVPQAVGMFAIVLGVVASVVRGLRYGETQEGHETVSSPA